MQIYNIMHGYLVKIEDEFGMVHSIDKMSVTWVYNSPGRFSHPFLDEVRDCIVELCHSYNLTFDSKSSLNPMSAFSWTYHYVRPRFGLPIFIGYQNVGKGGEVELKNCVRLEFNPNKVYDEDNLLDDIIRILNAFKPSEVAVKRLDYAIDIPVPLDDVVVLQSRKDKRYYKGTIYLGKRMSHNAVKIYDKQKEQNLDYPLTRFEITCRAGHKIKFDNVIISEEKSMDPFEGKEANATTRTLVKMCLALKEAGFDYEGFIRNLPYRRRREVIYYVEGIGQTLLFDDALFEELYKEVVERLKLGIEFPVMSNLMKKCSEFEDVEEDALSDIPFDDFE